MKISRRKMKRWLKRTLIFKDSASSSEISSIKAVASPVCPHAKQVTEGIDGPMEIVVLLLAGDVYIWWLLLLKYGFKCVCWRW